MQERAEGHKVDIGHRDDHDGDGDDNQDDDGVVYIYNLSCVCAIWCGYAMFAMRMASLMELRTIVLYIHLIIVQDV